jgi:hypothetical protein
MAQSGRRLVGLPAVCDGVTAAWTDWTDHSPGAKRGSESVEPAPL